MTTPGGQLPDGYGTGPAEGEAPLAAGPQGAPHTPPGFGPPGERPVLHGKPLAAPKVGGQKMLFGLMAMFAVLAAVGIGGFVMNRDVTDRVVSVVGDGRATLRPTFPTFPAFPTFPSEPGTPKATIPSGPVPKPVRYTGTGTRSFAIRAPEPGLALLYVKGNAAGERFFVSRTDAVGNRRGVVVAKFEPYEGVLLLDPGPGGIGGLRIEASGPWTVEVRSVRSAQRFSSGVRRSGDTVLWYTGPEATMAVTGGSDKFGATTVFHRELDGSRDLVALMVRRDTEVERWPAGPYLVEVTSDVPWSIRRT